MSSADEALVRPLGGREEAAKCAALMTSSEPWLTLGRSFETSLAVIQDLAREVHVAERQGAMAGFLILAMSGPFVGYVQTVCIGPEERGRGLGTFLVRWAEARIFRESPNVFLCVSSFNVNARRLYQRLGYSVVGELTDFLVEGYSEILMRKTMGPWSSFRSSP